jgi:hypothetical protein
MAWSFIHNFNPFLVPLCILAAVALGRRSPRGGGGLGLSGEGARRASMFQRALRALQCSGGMLVLLGACLIGLIMFELYYLLFECRVSARYRAETARLAADVATSLDAISMECWVDYASLLALLRQQRSVWDHNQDFSCMHPGARGVETFVAELQRMGFSAEYEEPRDLVQVFRNRLHNGPHVNVWLWLPDHEGEREFITTKDYTVNYRWREKEDIFPLQRTQWMGVNVSVPRQPHVVAAKEFDVYGGPGSYKKPLVFRGDCFFNFFALRWMY